MSAAGWGPLSWWPSIITLKSNSEPVLIARPPLAQTGRAVDCRSTCPPFKSGRADLLPTRITVDSHTAVYTVLSTSNRRSGFSKSRRKSGFELATSRGSVPSVEIESGTESRSTVRSVISETLSHSYRISPSESTLSSASQWKSTAAAHPTGGYWGLVTTPDESTALSAIAATRHAGWIDG